MAGKTVGYKSFGKGNGAALIHSTQHPSGEDWEACYGQLREDILSKLVKAVLVYSAGGAPLSNQRAEFVNLTRFHHTALSVVIDNSSSFIDPGGGYVDVSNWSGSLESQEFTPEKLDQAIEELELKDSSSLRGGLDGVRREVGA